MDQRQGQIKEGAGLEESRINTDFVDFIKKWSTPVLFVAAAISLGYLGLQKLEEIRVAKVDLAFAELEQARRSVNPSPESLLRLADDYSDIRAVAPMARLAAADVFLDACVLGFEPGAPLGVSGAPEAEEDFLTDEARDDYLDRAGEIYSTVARNNASEAGRELLVIEALYGKAAVAEMKGERDGAVGVYEELIAVAENAGYPVHAAIAQARIENVDDAVVEIAMLSDDVQPPAPLPGMLQDSMRQQAEEAAAQNPSLDDPTIEPDAEAPGADGPVDEAPGSDEQGDGEPAGDEPPTDPGQ